MLLIKHCMYRPLAQTPCEHGGVPILCCMLYQLTINLKSASHYIQRSCRQQALLQNLVADSSQAALSLLGLTSCYFWNHPSECKKRCVEHLKLRCSTMNVYVSNAGSFHSCVGVTEQMTDVQGMTGVFDKGLL